MSKKVSKKELKLLVEDFIKRGVFFGNANEVEVEAKSWWYNRIDPNNAGFSKFLRMVKKEINPVRHY